MIPSTETDRPGTRWGSVRSRLVLALFACTGLLAVVTGMGFLGGFTWWLELTSHFRTHYVLAAAAALLVFAVLRQWIGVALAAAVLAVNAAVVAPWFLPGPSNPNIANLESPTLRLFLSNVHTSNRDFAAVAQRIEEENPDIALLLETDARWADFLKSRLDAYPYRVVEPRIGNFGIALFSRIPLESGEARDLGGVGIPTIDVRFRFGGRLVRLLGTHPMPPRGGMYAGMRDRQIRAVAEAARDSGAHTIVLGDLNCTAWSPVFGQLLEVGGLCDSSRGFGFQPSWPTRLPALLRIGIDHCLFTPDFTLVDRRLPAGVGSDHMPLVVDLR